MADLDAEILVTGIRVIDLFAPVAVGGTLAIGGDANAGVNVVAMEVMQNLCRRYGAMALIRATSHEPFTDANVRTWVDRLKVGGCVGAVMPGHRAEIVVSAGARPIATLLPFAGDGTGADAMVTIRRAVMDSGRLPAVEVRESWSRLADAGDAGVAARARAALEAGNQDLDAYLAQPFFVAEPWTTKPGETTEREETVRRVQALIGG